MSTTIQSYLSSTYFASSHDDTKILGKHPKGVGLVIEIGLGLARRPSGCDGYDKYQVCAAVSKRCIMRSVVRRFSVCCCGCKACVLGGILKIALFENCSFCTVTKCKMNKQFRLIVVLQAGGGHIENHVCAMSPMDAWR